MKVDVIFAQAGKNYLAYDAESFKSSHLEKVREKIQRMVIVTLDIEVVDNIRNMDKDQLKDTVETFLEGNRFTIYTN